MIFLVALENSRSGRQRRLKITDLPTTTDAGGDASPAMSLCVLDGERVREGEEKGTENRDHNGEGHIVYTAVIDVEVCV